MGGEVVPIGDGDPVDLRSTSRFSVVAHHIYLFSAVGHFLFIGLFGVLGVMPLVAYNAVSTVVFVLCMQLNRREYYRTAFFMASVEVFVHSTLCAILIGWGTGFHYFIVGIIPFAIMLPRAGVSVKTAISVTIFIAYATVYFATMEATPPYPVELSIQSILNFMNLGIAFGAFTLLVHYLYTASVDAESTVQSISQTDQLTCLLNRRGMETHLIAARDALDRTGEPYSVILGDLDHFKRVNDEYGHSCGDSVLVAVGQALLDALRSRDVVCRWGGEEFLVLLPGTDSEGMALVAGKLLKSVQEIRVPCGVSFITPTITLGGATAQPGFDGSRLVTAADRALYEGKAAGRNRYVAAGRTLPA